MATGRRLLIICLLAFLAREASCQTLESLREDIKRAEREISITNDLLSKTRKNQQSADKELKLIRNKIRNRRNIISNLEQQGRSAQPEHRREGLERSLRSNKTWPVCARNTARWFTAPTKTTS